jgi:dihydroorotate dehydrogenase electron transfer subunit
VKVEKIEEECEGIINISFKMQDAKDYSILPKAGQFIMVWVPGVDEVPMSLSGADLECYWTITVKDVGECTNALCNLSVGDYIGVRGPLGTYFTIPEDNSKLVFLIGGGTGIAPLKFLAEKLKSKGFNVSLIQGAKKEADLIFISQFGTFQRDLSNVIYCTDDGSFGSEGYASKIFREELDNYSQQELSNALAYTCGPELMMREVFRICEEHNIPLEASLERMMRCGCGLCGLCSLDPLGLLVCKDGPVFPSEILRKIDDFGKYKRDITGRKISF